MRTLFTACVACVSALMLSLETAALSQTSPPPEEKERSRPELTLEGIILASDPSASVALVRRQGAGRGRSVRIGDTVYGLTLLEVTKDAALFERDGERFRLFIDEGRAILAVAAAGPSNESGDTAAKGLNGTVSEDGGEGEQWVVRKLDRADVEARLAKEMPVIIAETRVVPRTTGESQGLEITHLPDGTLLSELGLLPGDVLLSINDVLLDSYSTLAGLYPTLKSENEIRVVVERRGEVLSLAYDVR